MGREKEKEKTSIFASLFLKNYGEYFSFYSRKNNLSPERTYILTASAKSALECKDRNSEVETK